MKLKLLVFIINIINIICISGCNTLGLTARLKTVDTVQLPFFKNSANECYYLDEFMPIPDNLVAGKTNGLYLRYYSYKAADYRDYSQQHIILAFYSKDELCWSLYEEHYVND